MKEIIDRMFQREYETLFGTCTNNTADGPESTLTLDKIHQSMERVRQIMEQPRRDPISEAFAGIGPRIRVFESTGAVRRDRVKTYPKRKAKTPAHWARMDKKWRKRYGFREVPQMYIMQACPEMGTTGGVLVHPSHAVLLRNFTSGP